MGCYNVITFTRIRWKSDFVNSTYFHFSARLVSSRVYNNSQSNHTHTHEPHNWHNDVSNFIALDGAGTGVSGTHWYDRKELSADGDFENEHYYYYWNSELGYMGFRDLWMHDVHCRWLIPTSGDLSVRTRRLIFGSRGASGSNRRLIRCQVRSSRQAVRRACNNLLCSAAPYLFCFLPSAFRLLLLCPAAALSRSYLPRLNDPTIKQPNYPTT